MEKKVFKNKEEGLRYQKSRRRIILAVLFAGLIFVCGAALLALFLLGYFERIPRQSLLILEEDGRVIFEEVHELEEDYDIKEVERYAKDQIEAYNTKVKSRDVRFKRIWSEDGKICLKTVYRDARTYADFTGLTLYTGTIGKAEAAGYVFDGTYVVLSGTKAGEEISAEAAMKEDTNDVLILDQIVDIKSRKTPLYVSGAEASVAKDGTVRLSEPDSGKDEKKKKDSEEESQIQTTIIYK